VRKRDIVIGFVLGLAVGILAVHRVLALTAPAVESKGKDWEKDFYTPLVWAVRQVDSRYVDRVDPEVMFQGAVEGMMNRLDEHCDYIPVQRYQEFQDDTKGEFGGIGIQIRYLPVERVVRVEQPIPGTPAFRKGLMAGDFIVKAREESTGLVTESKDIRDVHDAVRVLRGPVGSKVTVTVVHKETGESEDVTITREVIKVPGVRAVKMVNEENRIGYVYVASFHDHAPEDLAKAVQDLKGQGMRALILDLRFNPGGLLKSAVEMSDLFLPDGIIVSTRGRGADEFVFRAEPGDLAERMPIVVLANRYSASASEIVVGALKDHHRAIIIGETSFGKGSVQTVLERGEGSGAIKLTTARYYTPNGVCIDKTGVKPHIQVDLDSEQTRQLALALSEASDYPPVEPATEKPKEQEAPAAPQGKESVPAAPEGKAPAEQKQPFHDVQLERAVDVLTGVLIQTEVQPVKAAAR
jgi:carboxyl-terminal processing protease